MSLRQGAGERHQFVSGANAGGKRICELRTELINQLAYRRTKAECRHPLCQPIDRNDSPCIDALAPFERAELWRFKLGPPPNCLHAAGGDDLSTWVEATLNEATAVPDRFHHTALVGECGDRSLHPSSPGLFDANVNNPHANRCRASAYKFSNWRDRSAVFVTPRKIEEEISHAMDP